MDIVAALFFEDIELRQPMPAGPSHIDLRGIHFSVVATSPPPVQVEPHLAVIVRCRPDEAGTGALEVRFLRGDEQIARNVQPVQVEPGRFSYRLVRAELTFEDYETLEAHCRLNDGPVTVVPYTLVPDPS